MQPTQLILASQSPRRQQLLKEMGYTFKTVSLDIDESYPEQLAGAQITEYLCKQKAHAYTELADNELLITADTIVWFQDKALEKPKSEAEAVLMLLKLSQETHAVYTSVGFKTTQSFHLITDMTLVSFEEISKEEALYYVQKFQPLDKAGSYGIQDWLGLCKVDCLNGSFYNVMGFPTHLVYNLLKEMKINPS